MKICVISTTVMECPPKGYSGLEFLAYQQAVGLANLGHSVLLVAPKNSQLPPNVELHGTALLEPEKQAYSGYWSRLSEFDAIIDNSWEKWAYILKMEGKLKAPILGVLHAPAETMYRRPPPVAKPCMVAISMDQAKSASSLWGISVETAYNGVDASFYTMDRRQRSDDYLFLARFSRIKGPHIAVDVAKKCGKGLWLVGDDTLTGEPDYIGEIKSSLTDAIHWVGPISRQDTVNYYNSHKALLHMNRDYREPFGLAPVEAQMCGMPVIAWDHGAMRETIVHGQTGFLVRSQEEVEDLVRGNAVGSLRSEVIRLHAMKFSLPEMIRRYDELLGHAVNTGGW